MNEWGRKKSKKEEDDEEGEAKERKVQRNEGIEIEI